MERKHRFEQVHDYETNALVVLRTLRASERTSVGTRYVIYVCIISKILLNSAPVLRKNPLQIHLLFN